MWKNSLNVLSKDHHHEETYCLQDSLNYFHFDSLRMIKGEDSQSEFELEIDFFCLL